MANTTNTTNTTKAAKDERVDVFVPRAGVNEDPNLYIGINGKEFLLPKGQVSCVPVYVKEAVECLYRANTYQEKHSQELIKKGLTPLNHQ